MGNPPLPEWKLLQLNTTLFIRTNRGVQLTPEGERLYVHVLSAMEQFQAAEEELADSSGLSHGSVAIGASETTAKSIFPLLTDSMASGVEWLYSLSRIPGLVM